MSGRRTRVWAALGVVVGVVAVADALTVWTSVTTSWDPEMTLVETTLGTLSYAAMGALIAIRAPSNRMGPLMLAVALAGSFQILFGAVDTSRTPLGTSESLGHWLYALASACQMLFVGGVLVLLLLAPTGRPLSPRWRYLIWLTAVAVGCASLDALIFREALEAGSTVQGFGSVLHGVLSGVGGALVIALVAVPVCLALRWKRAHGLERQQVLWVALGGIAGPLLVVFSTWLPPVVLDQVDVVEQWVHGSIVWSLAGCALPAGIAVAVLRHRLYDIDKVISRTAAYALVTGVLVAVYVAVVTAASWLLPVSDSAPVAAATLAAAAVFRPVLRRTQGLVDSRFNRSRFDAQQTVEAFAGRLRDEVDPDAVSADLLSVLNGTMEPSVVGLWVRRA